MIHIVYAIRAVTEQKAYFKVRPSTSIPTVLMISVLVCRLTSGNLLESYSLFNSFIGIINISKSILELSIRVLKKI